MEGGETEGNRQQAGRGKRSDRYLPIERILDRRRHGGRGNLSYVVSECLTSNLERVGMASGAGEEVEVGRLREEAKQLELEVAQLLTVSPDSSKEPVKDSLDWQVREDSRIESLARELQDPFRLFGIDAGICSTLLDDDVASSLTRLNLGFKALPIPHLQPQTTSPRSPRASRQCLTPEGLIHVGRRGRKVRMEQEHEQNEERWGGEVGGGGEGGGIKMSNRLLTRDAGAQSLFPLLSHPKNRGTTKLGARRALTPNRGRGGSKHPAPTSDDRQTCVG
eukprot:552278-Hanusia_phi.AAC.6